MSSYRGQLTILERLNETPLPSLNRIGQDRADAAAEIERLRSQLVKGEILWCCHVRGPDDVYAAPNYATALAWADMLNAINWRGDARYPKPLRYENPKSFEDCLIKATPAPWPHSAESHAESMPKNIAGFAEPKVTQSDD